MIQFVPMNIVWIVARTNTYDCRYCTFWRCLDDSESAG